jgi:hypothetical protein
VENRPADAPTEVREEEPGAVVHARGLGARERARATRGRRLSGLTVRLPLRVSTVSTSSARLRWTWPTADELPAVSPPSAGSGLPRGEVPCPRETPTGSGSQENETFGGLHFPGTSFCGNMQGLPRPWAQRRRHLERDMHQYSAIRVQQKPDASPFFLLAATAADLLEWADVPRKKAAYLAGYQRDLGDRHQEITKFLQMAPPNVIPGAVIVAVRPGTTTYKNLGNNVWQVTIATPPVAAAGDLLKSTYASFLGRLTVAERERVDTGTYDPVVPTEGDDTEDDAPPPSYLATLAVELRQAIDDWNSLSPERQQAVRDYVEGMAKPGLIIDGQHRVFGAKNVTAYDVVLPVILMPDLPAAEQVFHFYVLNNKAVPLKPTRLRNTVSTSLSDREIGELYERLQQAGVNADEARWTYKANTAPSSPFRNLVDFGLGETSAFLPENVMFQVIKAFVRPNRKYRMLSTGPHWSSDDAKLELFFAMWSAIAECYPVAWKAGVDNRGGQLFMKVTMLILQRFLFDDFVRDLPKRRQTEADWHPFASAEFLKESVKGSLYHLPENFFTKKWSETGLDTSERREFLYGQMEQAVQKFGAKIGTLPLFKAKSAKGGSK